MEPILEIKNISKKFKIDHEKNPYLSLREAISNFFVNFNTSHEDYWALRDVSFDVFPGETIGIIGKNGAGKSTLLKILSRITPPTKGKIIARGRIASLLEVGTGFHPELSGRENIFLNGSILGMKRKEIQNRFDEIVDFSGVEKFIDTPLKRYSSGMQLRLAFSVAAFLEPEILIIDEVLSVGDAEFQKKCMGKMEEVSVNEGRTVIFVSHNMGAVKKLCTKGILLKDGVLAEKGEMGEVAQKYLSAFEDPQNETDFNLSKFKNTLAFPTSIKVEDKNGNLLKTIPVGAQWQIRINFTIKEFTPHFLIGLGFKSMEDVQFRTIWTNAQDMTPGDYEVVLKENKVHYGVGKYKINLGFSSRLQNICYAEDCFNIEFEDIGQDTIALRADAGFILNQMESLITKK